MTAKTTFLILILSAQGTFADYYVSKASRGERTQRFDFGEECVVPKHFPGGVYRAADAGLEAELCSYDFYISQSSGGLKSVGLCPKVESTNPGVELFLFAATRSKEDFERLECPKRDDDRSGKKIAKFKQSLTCSYTPSILAYYHLSRLLGDIGDVPISVIRTMDKKRHEEFVAKAGEIAAKLFPNENPVIKQGWRQIWPGLHRDPEGRSNDGKSSRVFSQDHRYIYGALSQNMKKEFKYKELFGRTYETRYKDFKAKEQYKRLADLTPLVKKISQADKLARLTEAAQSVVQMRDIADMIVLDHILSQADRIGNIHYLLNYLVLDGSRVKQVQAAIVTDSKGNETPDPKQAKEMASKNAPLVKVMLVRDNDCGIIKSNEARNNKLLDGVKHISPETYKRVQWLDSMILSRTGEAQLRQFFSDEALLTEQDWTKTKSLIHEVAVQLKTACKAGQLHLDLDLQAVIDGSAPVDSRSLCEPGAQLQLARR